jgi:hypothetical protein
VQRASTARLQPPLVVTWRRSCDCPCRMLELLQASRRRARLRAGLFFDAGRHPGAEARVSVNTAPSPRSS